MIPDNFFPVNNPSKEQSSRGCISIGSDIKTLASGGYTVYALRQDLAEEWYAKNHKPNEGVEGAGSVFDVIREKKLEAGGGYK